jgi:hypothetical protein
MDIMNPFDPAAVDKEYKSGDDMLYGQYLLGNGSDIQAVAVVRRDPASGDIEQDQSSLAIKYHGFWGSREYDLLAAEHYAERIVGLGLSADIGGAVWRGDLVWTDAESGTVLSAVAGSSYSWVAGGRNWTGLLEYYYNGFGQPGGDYFPPDLASNPALLQRLARGEVFLLTSPTLRRWRNWCLAMTGSRMSSYLAPSIFRLDQVAVSMVASVLVNPVCMFQPARHYLPSWRGTSRRLVVCRGQSGSGFEMYRLNR